MKKIISEIRMSLAEKLISWSHDVAPSNEEGNKLKKHISSYYLIWRYEYNISQQRKILNCPNCKSEHTYIKNDDFRKCYCPGCSTSWANLSDS